MPYPDFVKIVELGPRDGLQNEPGHISTDTKVAFVNRLSAAGSIRYRAIYAILRIKNFTNVEFV